MVAYFYETVSQLFGKRIKTPQFCTCKTIPAGVFNACYMCNYKPYHK